ncbi:dipeptidase [Paenibacillus tengchongensis]|uniref:dipeptidase n=1 Tax=Paenibacillus tengchongensis TaxID=2608684 RepID=UPI00124DA0C6|nr:membrane dipeptidase [Paenibacillus tengchongensis]
MANFLKVADFHCDALSKLQMDAGMDFRNDPRLDVTLERLKAGNVQLQVFAVYLSEAGGRRGLADVLGQIELFHSRIAGPDGLRRLYWKEDMVQRDEKNAVPWALLSLEGVDGLEGNLFYAQALFELGVRVMGITWNYANWAADGVLEPRGGGFTVKGRQLIDWCNGSGMLLDVSHLSQAGFWELAERSERPFIASHSNCAAVCNHVRNLNDEQIKALIALDGRIGLTFVPMFVRNQGIARQEDMLTHIEHICSLGGSKQIMFGSDFDGIDIWVEGLEHPGAYAGFADLLLRHYPENEVRGWLYDNAALFLADQLPSNRRTPDK